MQGYKVTSLLEFLEKMVYIDYHNTFLEKEYEFQFIVTNDMKQRYRLAD